MSRRDTWVGHGPQQMLRTIAVGSATVAAVFLAGFLVGWWLT